jgi:signal transduction histidine kinase
MELGGLAIFPAGQRAGGPFLQQQMMQLVEIAAALSRAATPADVDGLLSIVASRAVGARTGTLYLDERDAPPPVADVFRTGQAVFLEGQKADPAAPRLAVLPIGPASSRAVLAFAFGAPATFSAGERELLEAIAGLFGPVLERSCAFATLEAARSRLERLLSQAFRLQELSERLSGPLSPEGVAEVAINQSVTAVGAHAGAIWLLDGEILSLVRSVNYAPEVVSAYQRMSLHDHAPLPDAVRARAPVFLDSIDTFAAHYPEAASLSRKHRPEGASGLHIACLPLVIEDRAVGGIALTFIGQRSLDEDERRFLATAARQCVQALERARLYQAEARANRAKDEFLAMLGHELRNPLSPIFTALQLMSLRDEASSRREREVIERQVRHLSRLVDDLLDISRITRGQVKLERRTVELADLVGKAIEVASPSLEERGHLLEVRVPRRGILVDADPARIAQALANLLTNAAKYTDPGGHVRVRGVREREEVVVQISDDGQGIAPELLPHIFDLFVQGEQKLDRARGGLGIGLTVVRNLVELHGGRVAARSGGRGLGSEFEVRLPAARERRAKQRPEKPTVRPVTAVPRRILVVDDNEDAADLLAEVLETLGHQVRVAHDGPGALVIAPSFAPELALLDIGLPVMDGYELAGKLRDLPVGAPPHMVAITGYGQEADRQRSRAAGLDEHLVKPVDIERLRRLIEELCS